MADLDSAAESRTGSSRGILLASLAARMAAVRAKAAENLLRLWGPPHNQRTGIARDFGSDPEAVFTDTFLRFAELIQWQPSPAWSRFIASMKIGFDQWHDGVGYDLDALAEMLDEERAMLREVFRNRLTDTGHAIDWREIEAADALGDRGVLELLCSHPESEVQVRAARLLGDTSTVERGLCSTLANTVDRSELSQALDLVPDYPTDVVKRALILRLEKMDALFVPEAMVLLEVFAGVEDAFVERPFLFDVKDQGAGGPLFRQLLARAGVE